MRLPWPPWIMLILKPARLQRWAAAAYFSTVSRDLGVVHLDGGQDLPALQLRAPQLVATG